jgi:hypothetical protein
MEANFVQIISAFVIIGTSSIPLHFALKINADKQRILSLLLLIALLAYAAHSILESFEFIDYQIFGKVCFIISALGLMTSYFFYQVKTKHTPIGGIFGVAMIVAFGTWMAGELAEAIIFTNESNEILDNISSTIMAGFGIFLIARFFWLRSIIPIESKAVRN